MCNREFASKDDLSVKICLRRKHFDPEFEGVLLHVTDIIRLINAADISLFINSKEIYMKTVYKKYGIGSSYRYIRIQKLRIAILFIDVFAARITFINFNNYVLPK